MPVFSNPTIISIPDSPTSTEGSTGVKSQITVSGLTGKYKVAVTLNSMSHSWTGDLDFLLVAPNGTSNLVFWSDVGQSGDLLGTTITVADNGATMLPGVQTSLATGTYRPADYTFAATGTPSSPGTASPETAASWGLSGITLNHAGPTGGATFASAFKNASPNGVWTLYARDDTSIDAGSFKGWSLKLTPDNPHADFNGNGTSDVLLQSGGTVVQWFLENGAYKSGQAVTTGAAGYTVKGAGDFNGDGVSDLVLQSGGAVLTWLLNADGSYKSGNVITTNSAGFTVVGTGDFNGDGIDDILLQNGGSVVTWLMNSSGQFQSGNVLTNAAAGFTVRATGDFNGDGITDVMLQSGGTVVNWMLNSSGGYQSGNLLASDTAGFTVRAAGDFNGDGIDDIVLQNGGSVAVWRLNSSGGYAAGTTITNAAGPYVVKTSGDYNGDGTDDILLSDGSNVVQWTMLNGNYARGAVIAVGIAGYEIL